MINYFKAAERTLSERSKLDLAIKNLERRRERAIRRGAPNGLKAIDYEGVYISGGGANDALSDCLELIEINRELTLTRETIEEIDLVLGQLDKADAALLRLWYIEHKSKEEIAEELSYSSRTSIYDLRNKAVSAFAILYYGAGALASV